MKSPVVIDSQVQIVDNVFVRMFHLEYFGDIVHGHAHTFDHITLLARGSVSMEANGVEKQYTAPTLIVTPKGVTHKFTALSIGTTLCCIHAIRDGDGVDDIAPPDITPEQAQELGLQFPMVIIDPSTINPNSA